MKTKPRRFAAVAIAFAIETTTLCTIAGWASPVAAQAVAVICGVHLYFRLGGVEWGQGWMPKQG